MKLISSLALVALITSLPVFAAKTYPLSSAEGIVTFTASGTPGNFKINGTTEKKTSVVTGNVVQDENTLRLESSFELGQLDTGIGLRTSHMKDKYLEVAKFPKATLKINLLSFKAGQENSALPFQGELELHGVKKSIPGTLTIKQLNDSLAMICDFSVNLTDFAIEIPSFAGVTVNNQVPIQVEIKNAKAQ
ncbi:MAG: YceI family protein [Deltaproteobacteria bacterium]